MLEEEGAKQNCCLPAWFCPSCEAPLPKKGERKRKEGSVRRVKRGEEDGGTWRHGRDPTHSLFICTTFSMAV